MDPGQREEFYRLIRKTFGDCIFYFAYSKDGGTIDISTHAKSQRNSNAASFAVYHLQDNWTFLQPLIDLIPNNCCHLRVRFEETGVSLRMATRAIHDYHDCE